MFVKLGFLIADNPTKFNSFDKTRILLFGNWDIWGTINNSALLRYSNKLDPTHGYDFRFWVNIRNAA